MFRRMVWASLRARRARLALSLVAVMLGVAVTTALATLALQVGDDLARTLRAAGPNFVVLPAGARLPLDLGGVEFLPPRAGLRLDETAVAGLKTGFWRNNVLEAAPELSLEATIDGHPATLAGAWFDQDVPGAAGWRTGVARLHPDWQLSGRWPHDGALEVVLGRDLATRLDVHPGQSVQLAAPGQAATTWRVTGTLGATGREGERGRVSRARRRSRAGPARSIACGCRRSSSRHPRTRRRTAAASPLRTSVICARPIPTTLRATCARGSVVRTYCR
jgi:hypothetical protein